MGAVLKGSRDQQSGHETYHNVIIDTWVYLQALETTSPRNLFLQSLRRRLRSSSSPLSILKRRSWDERDDDIDDSLRDEEEEDDEIPTGLLVVPRAISLLYDEALLELERRRGIPCSYDAWFDCRVVCGR